jgi:hypothetical protein
LRNPKWPAMSAIFDRVLVNLLLALMSLSPFKARGSSVREAMPMFRAFNFVALGVSVAVLSGSMTLVARGQTPPILASITFSPSGDGEDHYTRLNLWSLIGTICRASNVSADFEKSGTETGKRAAAFCTEQWNPEKWLERTSKLDAKTRAELSHAIVQATNQAAYNQAAYRIIKSIYEEYFPFGLVLQYSLTADGLQETKPTSTMPLGRTRSTSFFGKVISQKNEEIHSAASLQRKICRQKDTKERFTASGYLVAHRAVLFCDAVEQDAIELEQLEYANLIGQRDPDGRLVDATDERKKELRKKEEMELDRFFPAGVSLIL